MASGRAATARPGKHPVTKRPPHETPGLEPAQGPDHLAPGQGQVLPGHQVPEDDAPAGQELSGHLLGQAVGIVGGTGHRQQGPAAFAAFAPAGRGPPTTQSGPLFMTVASVPGLAGRQQGADGLEAVGGDDAPGHQVPEALLHFDRKTTGGVAQLGVEHGPVLAQRIEDVASGSVGRFVGCCLAPGPLEEPGRIRTLGEGVHRVARDGSGRTLTDKSNRRRCRPGGGRKATPGAARPTGQRSSSHQGLVVLHPGRERMASSQAVGGDLETLKLIDDGHHAGPTGPLGAGGGMLPAQQETDQILGRHRRSISRHPAVLGVGMDASQETSGAPLGYPAGSEGQGRTDPPCSETFGL